MHVYLSEIRQKQEDLIQRLRQDQIIAQQEEQKRQIAEQQAIEEQTREEASSQQPADQEVGHGEGDEKSELARLRAELQREKAEKAAL